MENQPPEQNQTETSVEPPAQIVAQDPQSAPQAPPTAQAKPSVSQPEAISDKPAGFFNTNELTKKSKKNALLFIVAGVVVLLLATAALLYFLVFSKHISAKDVSSAQNATNALSSDVNSINSSFNQNSPGTVGQLNSLLNSVQAKLSDAERQNNLLLKSNVLKDSKTDQSFKKLESKWVTYDAYTKNELSDSRAIFPPLYKFIDDAKSLAKSSPTTVSQLKTYLANSQQIITTALNSLKGAKAILPEDQQAISAIDNYLSLISKDVSTAQNDLNSGNLNAVETDLSTIDSRSTSLDNALSNVDKKSSDHLKKVDPSIQISDFQTALTNLKTQLGY